MPTLITEGIKVTIQANYQPAYSDPTRYKFVFSYDVNIENLGSETVQLLRRHWTIFDSNGAKREVEGEGVIGQQPIFRPGDAHSYASWCPLITEVGKMHGYYLFTRQSDGSFFQVQIPEFQLIAPFRLN